MIIQRQPKNCPDIPPPRSERGTSLAAMMTMSVIVGIVTTSMMGMIIPSYEKIGQMKNGNRVRSLSEAGIDYAIQQISAAKAAGTNSSFDPGNTAGAAADNTLSSSITGDPKATVNVHVEAVANPPKTSMLYDPLLEQVQPNAYRLATCTATVGGTTKQIRCLLEPIFDARPLSGSPKYPYAAFGIARLVFVGKSGINSYNTPLNRDPRVGADMGSLGKISQVHGGSSGLDRGITEGGSHYEFPSPVSNYNKQFGIVADQFNAQAVSQAPWMQMMGNTYSNGSNTAYQPRTPGESFNDYTTGSGRNRQTVQGHPEDNVFGLSNGIDDVPTGTSSSGSSSKIPLNNNTNNNDAWAPYPSSGSDNQWTGGVTNFASSVRYPQPQSIPPAPSAPSGTFDLGNVVLKSGAKIIFQDGAAAPTAPIGTISGKTITLPPGDYSMSSLTLSGGSKIDIPAGTSGDTNLYIQGASGGGNIMSVSNDSSINTTGISGSGMNTSGKNGIKNGSDTTQLTVNDPHDATLTASNIKEVTGTADNLHIYSNSSGTMQLQGNERMTIYAPYSTINVGSTQDANSNVNSITNDANFYGALVGGVINVMSSYSSGGGAYLHYDKNLKPPTSDVPEYINPYDPPSPFYVKGGGKIIGYRAVTWQEAVKANPAKPDSAQWTTH
jgi:hypothetical protein